MRLDLGISPEIVSEQIFCVGMDCKRQKRCRSVGIVGFGRLGEFKVDHDITFLPIIHKALMLMIILQDNICMRRWASCLTMKWHSFGIEQMTKWKELYLISWSCKIWVIFRRGRRYPYFLLSQLNTIASCNYRSADLIVEVAHPSISAEYGAEFLKAADFMVQIS